MFNETTLAKLEFVLLMIGDIEEIVKMIKATINNDIPNLKIILNELLAK